MVSKTPENLTLGLAVPNSVPEASAPSSVGTPESSNTQEEGMLLFVVHFPVFVLYNTLQSFHGSSSLNFVSSLYMIQSFVYLYSLN